MKYNRVYFDFESIFAAPFDGLYQNAGVERLLNELKDRQLCIGIIISERHNVPDEILLSLFGNILSFGDSGGLPDLTKMSASDTLFVLSEAEKIQFFKSRGFDCGLAVWAVDTVQHVKADCYFPAPFDVLEYISRVPVPPQSAKWMDWAMELQFIGQVGLAFSKDGYDRERFSRIREIAAEMAAFRTGADLDKISDLFCNEKGYQTPKLDTRAAIFSSDKILLVKEKSGKWSLPGGWVDVNESVRSNTVKEGKEEAGLDVVPVRVIALHDRNLRNVPAYLYGCCKVFVLCEVIGGQFQENTETVESRYFGLDELPELAVDRNSEEQVRMCFAASNEPNWPTLFD